MIYFSILTYFMWLKPETIKKFLLYFCLNLAPLVFLSYKTFWGILFPFTLIVSLISAFNFSVYLIWHYLIKDSNIKILNIEISCLKPFFKPYFYVISFLYIISNSTIIILTLMNSANMIIVPHVFFIINFIVFGIFIRIVLAKLTIEGIKNNIDVKNISFNDVYMELRKKIY